MPVIRSTRLEGHEKQLAYSTLLKRPDLRHRGSNLSSNSELYITVQPYSDSKPLTVHAQTPYKHFRNGRIWNTWLILPVDYSTLPANTQLAITVWDLSPINPNGGDKHHHIPFGGTTISLFDEDGTLRTGRQKCQLWRHKAADGFSNTTTPWQEPRKRGRRGQPQEPVVVDERRSRRDAELERLVGLMKQHEAGSIAENRWLDNMVFRQVEKLERQQVKDSTRPTMGRPLNGEPESQCAEGDPDHVDGTHFLYIEFPRFDHPVIFTDREYPPPPISHMKPHNGAAAVNFKPPPAITLGPGIQSDGDTDGGGRLIGIYDPEVGYAENPAENKHRRLIRGQRNALDKDLKPNPKMRDFLHKIIMYGPTVELTDKEKDEVWRFRHHLSRNKRALTKLMKSVNWSEPSESRQAIALLPKWVEIDVDDALELLGPGFQNSTLRAYAVDRLRKSDDDELLLYLLQLVQALKFEPESTNKEVDETDSSLASFLIARSAANFKLVNFFYWYLQVEIELKGKLSKLFRRVSDDFMAELDSTPTGKEHRETLHRQGDFVGALGNMCDELKKVNGRLGKIERLKKMLADPKYKLLNIDPPLPLPLDPSITITGVISDSVNVFKSTLSPILLRFTTTTGDIYPLLFKKGDDLRQDQLVVQIIALMDRLLLKENLDLKLTPYRVLSTSQWAGAVQFIPDTVPLSVIDKGNPVYKGLILEFLRHHNPPVEGQPSVLEVNKVAMDNYIKSVAGYCVITYILGVGDRHLDNLMMAEDGRFMHIDFGFILGRDPKYLAPEMKLSMGMVDGMGGFPNPNNPKDPTQYNAFRQYCFTAYTTLRRSSNLILNLFRLMQDAGIEGLEYAGGGDAAVRKVEERFKLDVSEDVAVGLLSALMEKEMKAWGAAAIDTLHRFTMGLKGD